MPLAHPQLLPGDFISNTLKSDLMGFWILLLSGPKNPTKNPQKDQKPCLGNKVRKYEEAWVTPAKVGISPQPSDIILLKEGTSGAGGRDKEKKV